ncbi:MAG TPA: hypothetical protein VGL89_12920 [Candidatus Koribacter sp.]|jgi:hypothetical protein
MSRSRFAFRGFLCVIALVASGVYAWAQSAPGDGSTDATTVVTVSGCLSKDETGFTVNTGDGEVWVVKDDSSELPPLVGRTVELTGDALPAAGHSDVAGRTVDSGSPKSSPRKILRVNHVTELRDGCEDDLATH